MKYVGDVVKTNNNHEVKATMYSTSMTKLFIFKPILHYVCGQNWLKMRYPVPTHNTGPSIQ